MPKHDRLDQEKRTATAQLDRVLLAGGPSDDQAAWQRRVAVNALSQRVSAATVATSGLCFGRLDDQFGGRDYIGRMGLFDETDDYQPLLIDWRAPAARPFYCATPANPDGVRLRRHFRTSGRQVLDFHDDILDSFDPNSTDLAYNGGIALLAALNAPRDGTMRDIAATIQAEQDEIIRLPDTGVVVIEGGPGTGKTAVALHRVAYLLYTQRQKLSRRGVLIIGPNTGFLRYVSEVLPALGETGVVFATTGTLLPGLRTTAADPGKVRRVKGSLAMVDVLTAAIADRQELPTEPIAIELDDGPVLLDRRIAATARDRACRTGLPHNEARTVFWDALLAGLTERAVARICAGWLRPGEAPELRADLAADVGAELAGSAALQAALDQLWPRLTGPRLLADLFGSATRLAVATAMLPAADRELLYRSDGAAWTGSDVPLLDEAAELLGVDPVRRHAAERAQRLARAERLAYAKGVLEILAVEDPADPLYDDQLLAADALDSAALAQRQADHDSRSVAERAEADRDWTYGHIVVDEAQELSEMDWRVVMRHCPSRSVTIVGDLAQRESPAGARSWTAMLHRYVAERWTYRGLTVNYRTPAELMDIAASVLAEVDPTLRPPTSVRHNGMRPWAKLVRTEELADVVRELAAREAAAVGAGSVAVIVPPACAGLAVAGAVVLTAHAAKGLEFDAVIIVEPQWLLADAEHGPAALYVALTRATQRLGVVHTQELPAPLRGLHAE